MQREITDDLDALLDVLPPDISDPLRARSDNHELLEIVMDLGRLPEARYPGRDAALSSREIAEADIDYVVNRIGEFGDDNRAGIERTLHRISAIRNRRGRIVGLTCRVGRAVYGTIAIIDDLVQSEQSILLLGRPGVGKTTLLRETARVLADDMNKRVIIVDTSNEIAGDGDIPHPAIGSARRMQVSTPTDQHATMIEAVENHMPEVIVIDEIGTELEAAAARTIAERGVKLVGTAHGNTLENLMMNPTLSDLIGGIQSVTLGDEEARRRGTQKSILERKAPPTFDVLVEIQSWDRVAVHTNVAETVDAILRGYGTPAEIRELTLEGDVQRSLARPEPGIEPAREGWSERRGRTSGSAASGRQSADGAQRGAGGSTRRIYPFGVARGKLEQAVRDIGLPVRIADSLEEADAVLTLRNYWKRKPGTLRDAEDRKLDILVAKNNTVAEMAKSLMFMREPGRDSGNDGPGATTRGYDPVFEAMRDTEDAIAEVMNSDRAVDLAPTNSYIRRIQHQIAQRYNVQSQSHGREPYRRVRISPGAGGNHFDFGE
ncbi:MAG: AAA family ATPase [Chloroflexi bacterium]|nr:AAA family ATPase [Chloroflexota bacterium]